MNKKLLIGIISGICVVALVLGLVLGLNNCAGTEPTDPSESVGATGKPTKPTRPQSTDPNDDIPVVEGGISYYSGVADYSWYDPTSGAKEYTLYTADQLYGLAELVNTMGMKFEGTTFKLANHMVINEGDASKWNQDAFLVPWVPLGKSWTNCFSGTIDGQGHYISGLFSVQPKNNGFICYSQGATVKNLAIVNSYFQNTNEDDVQAEVLATFVGRGRGVTLQNLYSDAILVGGGYSTGGIVAYTQSAWDAVTKSCLVESCVFAGQIKNASGKGTGGILGHDNGSKYSVTVKDCLFIGTLDSKNANCGGIVGFFSGESKLINCVSAGKVTSTNKDFNGVALIGSASGSSTISNNYYVSTKSGKAIGTGSPALEEGNMGLVRATMKGLDVAKVMPKLDFAKTWTALEGTYPVPTGVKELYDLLKKPLTEDTSDDSDKASSGSQSGTTTPVGEVDTSWYDESKDSFTISTVKQLYGLAQLVNEGKDFAGKTVKLSKDLTINSGSASKWTKETTGLKAWVPIGSTSGKQFKGTFDGQGHYISGIFSIQKKDNGLFGYAKDATVKNLAVINSYFENTGATSADTRSSGQRLSAFVATGENVKLSGLYSNAILNNAGTDLGGIIGYAKGETSVDSCAFAGTILSDGFERRNYGGIVGYNERGVLTVSNCLFSGKMDTKTHLQGGIVGRSNINGTTIKNCVSVGEVKSSHGSISSGNAIIGAIKADLEDTTVTIENCYYLNGSQTCGFAENTAKGTATLKEVNVVKLDEASAKGESVASVMTKLDFKSVWSALKDNYPIPKAVKAMYESTLHKHSWATAWTTNGSHHWHECTATGCDLVDNAGKNGYGEHVYANAEDETCDTCGYKRTIVRDDGTPSVYSGTPDTSWYKDEETLFILTTADQLYGFAELVNGGKDFDGKTVKLGKNMVINEGDAATWGTTKPTHEWTPIAVATGARFRGTFDGQGKYISGIYSYQKINNGLFVYLEGGAVLNVAVINSYFENYGDSGNNNNAEVLTSVVGRIYDAGTVKNIYSNAYVVTAGKDYHTGGIIGWARSSKETVPTIDSCIFAGTIITNSGTAGSNVGGIIGGNDTNAKVVEISNCLMIGYIHSNDKNVGGIIGTMRGSNTKLVDCVVATTVKYTGEGTARGPVIGNMNTDKGQLIVENCYYVAEVGAEVYGAVVDSSKITLTDNCRLAADDMKVQANFPGLDFANTWTQTDEVPVPTALKAIYEANKVQHVCEFETTWSYDSEYHWHACSDMNCDEIKDKAAHDFGTDGLADKCSICNANNPNNGNTGTPDTSWYNANSTDKVAYIMTEDQLLGLATLVNNGTTTFDGWTIYLGDDLMFNEGDASTWSKSTQGLVKWTPIGTSWTNVFKGTFDGLGHTISGIWSIQGKNNAMFAYTQNATIKNLSIVNSYFESTNAPGDNGWGAEVMGTFVGRGRGIQASKLYTDAILVGGGPNTGGIVGYSQSTGYNECIIDSCVFAGQIRNHATSQAGGILGSDNGHIVTVKNCMFTGSIETTGKDVGGLVGRLYKASTVDGCISTGTVTSTTDGWSNIALVGNVSADSIIKNNRYQNVAGGKKFGTGTPAVDENNVGIGPVLISVANPTITTQPIGADYESTDAATALKVVAAVTDNGTLTYQWFKSTTSATDGFTAIAGATEATYTPALDEDAWYRCEVTSTNLYVSGNKTAKVTSEAVKIHVHSWSTDWDYDSINHFYSCSGCDDLKDKARHASADGDDICDTCGQTIILAAAPQIGGQPAGPLNGANVDDDVDLIVNNATVTDGGTITYQWYSNTTNSAENGTEIPGETQNLYTFVPEAPGVYYFYCVVTNTNAAEQVNETVSNVAVVHVHGWKTEWAMDANNHWHECETADCPITENSGKKGYGPHALVNNLCSCGYVGPVSFYDAALGEDTSWYDASKSEYVLTNANQLYGLKKLVNSGTTFAGKKITLACNMVINQGDASAWTASSNLVKWEPIGTSWTNVFKGTFDGAEHYVSGIWSVQTKNNAFFCYTQNATVKNLSIINSYFESTGGDNWGAEVQSSVVGLGQGITLKNVYSNAILVGGGAHTGGICAYTQGEGGLTNPTIDSCVFAGVIKNATGDGTGGILGGDNNKKFVTITNCLNLGTVSSTRICGGIAGYLNYTSQMKSCLNVGAVTSTNATYNGAALLGSIKANTVVLVNSYYDKANNSKITGAGSTAVTNVEGKTTAELKGTTLVGFEAWTVVANDYPIPTGVKDMYETVKTIMVATTPSITTEPQGAQYNIGASVSGLNVEATGDAGVLSYQWQLSTVSATEGFSDIQGATGSSYKPDVSGSGNVWYRCVVTNTNSVFGNSSTATSASAMVHVHDWDETKYEKNEEYHWNTNCAIGGCTETDPSKMGNYEQHTTFGNHVCSECEYVGAVSYYDADKGKDTSWYVGHESDTSYTLTNANQLYGLAELVNGGVSFSGKTIYLGVNIVINKGDASTWQTTDPANTDWTPIGKDATNSFKGTLNGNGHYISGLYSKKAKENGLFGFANGATIQNLAVLNSLIWNDGTSNSNAAYQGTFVARGTSVTLRNLYTDAYLHSGGANDVGGIMGDATTAATIDSCVFVGSITNTGAYSASRVAGILGTDQYGAATISNCLFSGSINGKMMMGGRIIGRVYKTTTNITGCVGGGTITQSNTWPSGTKAGPVAGIAGHTKVDFTITNCYYPEGCNAIGWIEAGAPTVTDCYATATTGLNALSTMNKLDSTNWTATTGYPIPTGIKEIYNEKALFEAYLAAQN